MNLAWAEYASLPPSSLESENITHVTPFLLKLGIKLGHRAHALVTLQDLLDTHRFLWQKAALKSLQEGGMEESKEDLWRAAVNNDHAALWYFGKKRGELDSEMRSFCVILNPYFSPITNSQAVCRA